MHICFDPFTAWCKMLPGQPKRLKRPSSASPQSCPLPANLWDLCDQQHHHSWLEHLQLNMRDLPAHELANQHLKSTSSFLKHCTVSCGQHWYWRLATSSLDRILSLSLPSIISNVTISQAKVAKGSYCIQQLWASDKSRHHKGWTASTKQLFEGKIGLPGYCNQLLWYNVLHIVPSTLYWFYCICHITTLIETLESVASDWIRMTELNPDDRISPNQRPSSAVFFRSSNCFRLSTSSSGVALAARRYELTCDHQTLW